MNREETSALLRLRTGAALLDIHEDTLRRWTREGRVPYQRLGSRGDLRYRRCDLEGLLHKEQARKGKGSL